MSSETVLSRRTHPSQSITINYAPQPEKRCSRGQKNQAQMALLRKFNCHDVWRRWSLMITVSKAAARLSGTDFCVSSLLKERKCSWNIDRIPPTTRDAQTPADTRRSKVNQETQLMNDSNLLPNTSNMAAQSLAFSFFWWIFSLYS